MLPFVTAVSTFVAPAAKVGSRVGVAMQFGPPSVDEDRRGRSPGLENNFYDVPTSEFKRPYSQPGPYDGGRGPPPYERGPYGPRPNVGGGTFGRYLNDAADQREGYGPYNDGPYDYDYEFEGQYDDRRYDEYGPGMMTRVRSTFTDIISVLSQFTLLISVLAAPSIPGASTVSSLLGFLFIASGGLLGVSAALDLSTTLTPFPNRRNGLQTDGVYALCRHPMYTGLISACVGLGLLSGSPERLLSRVLITSALCALLWYQADREEDFLERKFGPEYVAWASRVPRFFPEPEALFAEARVRGSESALGGLLSTGITVAALLVSAALAVSGK